MTVIKLEIRVYYQKFYGPENLEYKKVSVENALRDQRSMREVIKSCKKKFPAVSGPKCFILEFVDLRKNRHLELRQSKNKSLSSLVDQNRDYCSNDGKITMMMYLFSLAPSTPITESEFAVEFFVKIYFYNPYDRGLNVTVKKHFLTDSNNQTPISEMMKRCTRKTLEESGEEIDENEEEKVFYYTLNSKGTVRLTSNEPVQKFVERHREALPHLNRITVAIHAFYIEKVDQHSSDESTVSSS